MKLPVAISLVIGLAACKSDGVGPHVAGSASRAGSAASAHEMLARPLFWKVEKGGATTYMLGTMHVGVDPEKALPPIVWKTLDDAPAFAMETDLDKAASLDVLRHDGTTLHGELGDAYWAKLETALGKDQAARVDGMKVMIPATLLSMRGLPDTPAMDGALLARAQAEHKAILFLEPIEAEEAVLDKWLDAKMLEAMLDDLPGEEQHAREMLAAYVAGDDAKIEALSEAERADWKRAGKSDKDYDAQLEDLLFSRNASWVPELEKLHEDGGGFVAVGALHLIGNRSVLALLRQRGYVVTRLTP